MNLPLKLKVQRTGADSVATYSSCELWRGPVCLYRRHGIENTKLKMAAGTYPAKWTRSPRFSRMATEAARKLVPTSAEVDVFTWEILGVMDGTRERAGLRLHPVNFAKDLLGCLAFGMELADLNGDGVIDLARSREAHRQFNQACGNATEMEVAITEPVDA